jgi:hypothetical protein
MMRSVSFSIGQKPTELNGIKTKGVVRLGGDVTQAGERTLDANLWLPRAAEHYRISPKLSDYVIVPVPSIISELPNTNGDSVSKDELMRFKPDYGQLAYRTWIGKPTFIEHQNKDITQAKGVILDVFLRRLPATFAGGHVKVIKLLAFDRTKDPELVQSILLRKFNTYSLGMYYKQYQCSICGSVVSQSNARFCDHTNLRRKTYMRPDGELVFRKCQDITGFECSAVADPAYVSATSDIMFDVSRV